ncbi:MFS transporter [Amycolatopsis acidiphila]|uniref:MFS transporter n=1 Tax=Amycolatopsis acidiphila TaxID=715473 RepID=A0A558A203_9PSEU|nr:MFS transporter [Amycolatopsis acidiphila]TVT18286.1 MFS transporter [Amycolatopsis acidiphila]UIJ57949.1 MFS transporter [Amycolatopsis acidiphila]GHG70957.1 MFS transporter [Amycolatopsis acidiphila]
MSTVRITAPVGGGVRPATARILIFAFLGTLFDGAELNLVGYPLAYLSDSLHVSTIQLVQVSTLQGFASIAGGILCGWLGDLYGRRWTYTGSVVMFGLAALLGGLAPNYLLFLLTRLLAGVGMGGLFGLSYSMFAEAWKTRKRGLMGGSIQSMYMVGQIVTEGIIYFCIVGFGTGAGWRAGYILIGIVTLLIGVASAVLLPESEQWRTYQKELKEGRVPENMRRTKVPILDLFRGGYAGGTILFMAIATALFLTTNSMISYLSTFLIKVEKVPLGTASLIVLLNLIVTAVTYPLAGMLSDAIRRKWAMFVAGAFGIIGFAWFLVLVLTHSAKIGPNFWVSPTFWALMMCAAAASGFGVLGIWMAEFFPTRVRSSGSNLAYYAGRGFGAGLFPLVALSIAGTVPLALAFGIVGPVAAAVLALAAPDRTGRKIEAIE